MDYEHVVLVITAFVMDTPLAEAAFVDSVAEHFMFAVALFAAEAARLWCSNVEHKQRAVKEHASRYRAKSEPVACTESA
jgi:hypothetical protein